MNGVQRVIYESLSPADRHALADYIDYVSSMANPKINPGGNLPEGSLQALFARQSPGVQSALMALDGFIETPRTMPFDRKLSEAERLASIGIDVAGGLTAKAASDGLEVLDGVQERLGGTDANRKPEPPSLRDHVAKAAAVVEPHHRHESAMKDMLAEAGASVPDMSLRDHLELAGDAYDRGGNDPEPDAPSDMRSDIEWAIENQPREQ